MLGPKNPTLDIDDLLIQLLRLRVAAFPAQSSGQSAHYTQRPRVLRPMNPAPDIEQFPAQFFFLSIVVLAQQGFQLCPQRFVRTTSILNENAALLGFRLKGRRKQVFKPLPLLGVYLGSPTSPGLSDRHYDG